MMKKQKIQHKKISRLLKIATGFTLVFYATTAEASIFSRALQWAWDHLIGPFLHWITHPVETIVGAVKSVFTFATAVMAAFGINIKHPTQSFNYGDALSPLASQMVVAPAYEKHQSNQTFTSGQSLTTQLSHSKHPYENKLDAFKQSGQACSGSNCSSTTSSNTLKLNQQYNNSSQYNAATQYTKNASGTPILSQKSIKTTNAPTPETINYIAHKKTQDAIQSAAANHLAATQAKRTPTNTGTGIDFAGKSSLAHNNYMNHDYNNSNKSSSIINDLPIIGHLIGGTNAFITSGNALSHATNSTQHISTTTNLINVQTGQMTHMSIGNQLSQNVKQSMTTTPRKTKQ